MEAVSQALEERGVVRSTGSSKTVMYLHVYTGDGESAWEKCLELGCRDLTLVSIGNLDWSDDACSSRVTLNKGDRPPRRTRSYARQASRRSAERHLTDPKRSTT